jgi:hypothetical protein
MKKNSLLMTAVAILGLTTATLAQNVPSYMPTNGLVGWWPFNGNANDESGNGNNGTVNGAMLTNDRFGNNQQAFEFQNQNIDIQNFNVNYSNITISFWIKPNITNQIQRIVTHNWPSGSFSTNITNYNNFNNPFLLGGVVMGTNSNQYFTDYNNNIPTNNWSHFILVNNSTSQKLYINSVLVDSTISTNLQQTIGQLYFGGDALKYYGKLDDIGIWNRALSQQEITNLYNAINCSNNATISPQTNTITIGSLATFSVTISDPNLSYVWQSNLGQGFQTLNDVENYSGTNTSTLNIANVQLSEHLQPIRVITTSGECIDTSEVATISILDTCITLINDTTFITVTDTLLINTLITGINPPNNSNTIKVYPNPTNDHITIEYGDFAIMNGYQLRIENSLGQEVFQTSITQDSDYLNLNPWGGNGLYFVHIVDPQGNTIDIRKIVLQ